MKKALFTLIFAFLLGGCASYNYPQMVSLGDNMINAEGEALDGTSVSIPGDFAGEPTLLLFGYVHKSQFDIDRWLIGLDMTGTKVAVYEIPTLKGMFPDMFSTFIDDAMREGIPKEIWKGVVTVYEDGDAIQRFTGNKNPKNSRVMLLDAQGKVIHFYDRGFSVDALNAVRAKL
jgi:cytochrome oxidase Cu insertion factor (SCO1/SenC/PrrC family)